MVKTQKKRRRRPAFGKDLKKHIDMLRMLHEAKEHTRRGFLKCCPGDVCNAIAEVASNTLKGNIPLTDAQYAGLKRHAKDLEALTRKKTSLTKKRQIIQKGGFITALLGPALRLLTPVIGSMAKSLAPSIIPDIVGSMTQGR